MSTSIADLLHALDIESRSGGLTPADSAAALGHTARATLMIASHLDVTSDRYQPAMHQLGLLGHDVSAAWPAEPGRCAQLAGVLEDAVALNLTELDQNDLRVAAVGLSACITRFGTCIQDNSAACAPLLDDLLETAHDLRRRHAAQPVSARGCVGLYQPFALASVPGRLTPGQACAEAIDGIADYLNQRSRNPLTIRQIIAVCRVAEVITTRLEQTQDTPGSHHADRWTKLRGQIALLTDGLHEPGHAGNGRIMLNALTAEHAITAMDKVELNTDPTVKRVAATLPLLAPHLERELRRIQPTLLVPVGDRPLSQSSAGMWLTHRTFQPRLRDLAPIFVTLEGIGVGVTSDADAQPRPFEALTP